MAPRTWWSASSITPRLEPDSICFTRYWRDDRRSRFTALLTARLIAGFFLENDMAEQEQSVSTEQQTSDEPTLDQVYKQFNVEESASGFNPQPQQQFQPQP